MESIVGLQLMRVHKRIAHGTTPTILIFPCKVGIHGIGRVNGTQNQGPGLPLIEQAIVHEIEGQGRVEHMIDGIVQRAEIEFLEDFFLFLKDILNLIFIQIQIQEFFIVV